MLEIKKYSFLFVFIVGLLLSSCHFFGVEDEELDIPSRGGNENTEISVDIQELESKRSIKNYDEIYSTYLKLTGINPLKLQHPLRSVQTTPSGHLFSNIKSLLPENSEAISEFNLFNIVKLAGSFCLLIYDGNNKDHRLYQVYKENSENVDEQRNKIAKSLMEEFAFTYDEDLYNKILPSLEALMNDTGGSIFKPNDTDTSKRAALACTALLSQPEFILK